MKRLSGRRLWILRAVLLLCVIFVVVSATRMISMPGESYAGPPVAADASLTKALEADVTFLASDIGERNLGNEPEALNRAAEWLVGRLSSLGYEVRSQPFKVGDVEVRNRIVERRGVEVPDEFVVGALRQHVGHAWRGRQWFGRGRRARVGGVLRQGTPAPHYPLHLLHQ